MDIVSLAITGAVGQLTKEIIHEGYMVLRNTIIRKYGQDSRIANILQKIESSPASDKYRKDLVNEIKILKAFEDGEIIALAQSLQKKLNTDLDSQSTIIQRAGDNSIQIGQAKVVNINRRD